MPAAAAAALAGALFTNTALVGAAIFVANYGAAILTVGALVIQTSIARRQAESQASDAAQQAREAYNAALQDRTTVIRSPVVPRNIVLGRDRTSGPLAAWFTWGSVGQAHTFAVVLAGHECDAVEEIYFNDDLLTLDGAGNVTAPAKYLTAAGLPLFSVEKYLGGPGQAASPTLIAAAAAAGVPTAWDATRIGTGVCYLVINMTADYDALGQIGVPNVSAVVRGVKAYDPRTGLTLWTENPAILARWFLVESIYSPPTLSGEINATELISSANVCDELIYITANTYAPRYTANGALNSAASPLVNLNHILQAMDGDAVWIAGAWQVMAGYYRTPALTLDESALSDAAITIQPYAPRASLFNAVSGTFIGPQYNYEATSYPLVQVAQYLSEDNGEELVSDVNFVLVNTSARCQMIGWQRLTRARQQLTVQLGTNLKGYDTAPLQNVTLNLAEFGYVSKVFSVRRRQFVGNQLQYTLQETAPEVWAWDANFPQADVDLPNTSLPDSHTVPVLTGITANSGTAQLILAGDGTVISRILLGWTLSPSTYVQDGGRIEWRYRVQGATEWLNARTDGTETALYLAPVQDGAVYELQGRAANAIGQRSAWSTLQLHTVIGKTAPPSDVISFAVNADGVASWAGVSDIDLAGYQLRWQPGNNRSWGNATPLHQGIITDSPYTIAIRPSGITSFMVKAVDTSGNESALPAVSVTQLGDPIVANVITAYDYRANTWPGTITNASISGGNLVADADATPLAWDADEATAGWTLDTDAGWTVITYKPVTYLPSVFIVDPADAGVQLTLPSTISATAYLIEYRRDGDALGWTTDAEPGWTTDTDLAWLTEAWLPWPGAVTAVPGRYEWQITTQSRDVQSTLSALTAQLDVSDQFENCGQVSILSAGTAIPTTKTWRAVTGIGLTLVADGGTARNARVESLSTRTVTTRDNTNTAVDGTVLATLQGY